MSFTRDEIVNFLEKNVHRTLTLKSAPEKFTMILQALYDRNRQLGNNKFEEDTLNNVEAIKITRMSTTKALIVQLKYKDSPDFTTISWKKLYKNNEKTIHNQIVSAFRFHIHPQLVAYRLSRRVIKCDLCDNENNLEVDHMPPRTFSNIFKSFITLENLTEEDVSVWWSSRHSKYMISDKYLKEKWIDYHNQQAIYRILCGNCNKITRI